MNFTRIATLTGILIGSTLAFAHGEDSAGPHGGFVRMPGAFHTEVVLKSPNRIEVYLLDAGFKNPTVTDSSVKAVFKSDKVFLGRCEKKETFFYCEFERAVDLGAKGRLMIEATREKQRGGPAVYVTPLKPH